MKIDEILTKYHISQTELATRFEIPLRSVQNWVADGNNHRDCPQYVINMIDEILSKEIQ